MPNKLLESYVQDTAGLGISGTVIKSQAGKLATSEVR